MSASAADGQSSPQAMGDMLRRLRTARRLSLRDLGEAVGLSVGYLSKIERSLVEPSVPVLRRLAAEFGIEWIDFYQAPAEMGQLVRKADRPLMVPAAGQRHYAITRTPGSDVEIGVVEYEPGASVGDDRYTHGDVHEVLLILDGELEFTLAGVTHLMAAGDSIEFRSSVPHAVRNASERTAEALWVSNPPAGTATRHRGGDATET
ncbi:cupin domain-containing protein [Dactylosporangium sp. NPDC000555]|uniref:cupin domain-containing protein n=1 Tax=Dactylosporangium sp. NPDC000555 TaxID=3154260 RepID=UPI00332E30B7